MLDFDGVIADTENIHVAAWQRTLAAMGWEVSDEASARAVEVDDHSFLGDLFASRGVSGADLAGWVRRKQALTASMMADSPRLYPGVPALIRALRGRVRLAVVTTTWRENVAIVLRAMNLSGSVELVVGKEDVRSFKPDPECYREALARLGVSADDAVALEDSPSGVAAARGAGVRVLAIGTPSPPGRVGRLVRVSERPAEDSRRARRARPAVGMTRTRPGDRHAPTSPRRREGVPPRAPRRLGPI